MQIVKGPGDEQVNVYPPVRAALDTARPATLYHYADREQYLAILGTNRLVASDIRFVDGAAALDHGFGLIAKAIQQRETATTTPLEKVTLDSALVRVQNRSVQGLFIASFDTDGDRLSQWRAFGQRDALSIGFPCAAGAALDRIAVAANNACFLVPVEVHANNQTAAATALVAELLTRVNAKRAVFSGSDNDFKSGPLGDLLVEFSNNTILLAASMKAPAFKDEDEWRLCTYFQQRPIKVRLSHSAFVPFVEVALDVDANVHSELTAIVGPGRNSKADVAAAQIALMPAFSSVSASKFPYRNW